MATELATSPILEELAKIQAADGSPYYRFGVSIHCGGVDIVPYQVLSYSIDRNYREHAMDGMDIVVAIGAGTLVYKIGPFQDDIKLTVNVQQATTTGADRSDQPISSRTYRAYLADHIDRPTDSTYNPTLSNIETADRSSIKNVRFILEEVAVEQLRKQSLGFIGRSTPPFEVMRALLVKSCQALKLDKDEVISSFDLVPPNNTTPRTTIIPDATPVLEIPDHLQNDQGGIYSTGLGFYIQGRCVYSWPMYDTTRQDSASTVLNILLAPTRHSVMLDKTWRKESRQVIIYCAGVSKIVDESLGNLNTQGNAVRFADSSKLLESPATVSNNKVTFSRTSNNNEYATSVVGNGQNYATRAEPSANPYLETSKMAKRAGAHLVLSWRRSNPDLLTPGMPVEVDFDLEGTIRTMEGVLLQAYHVYELEGQGMTASRATCSSSIVVFVDRNDPDYLAFVKAGGQVSPTPDIGEL